MGTSTAFVTETEDSMERSTASTAVDALVQVEDSAEDKSKSKSKGESNSESLTKAKAALAKAMSDFHMAIKLEPKNAHAACKAQHEEYEALKKDVAARVEQRKGVYIATHSIRCYVTYIFHNSIAEECRKKEPNLKIWDITAGKLPRCPAIPTLTLKMGPANFKPTKKSCKKIKAMVVDFVDTRLIVAAASEDSWLATAEPATTTTTTTQVTSTASTVDMLVQAPQTTTE